ncbi:MAG: hypothetical protein RSD22_08150 [Romboutsia sp.]
MNVTLDESLDNLNKKLYLESPDLWIELSDKINDKVFDERILFFAIKYDMFSIIKHVIDNNLVDLDNKSKNKYYNTIKDQLIDSAKQYNCTDALNYFNNDGEVQQNNNIEIKVENNPKIEDKITTYMPKFSCPKCDANIFENGYKIYNNMVYKFSPNQNKLVEMSKSESDFIVCCSCESTLDDVSPNKLKSLCEVQTCGSCGVDLTEIGIVDKSKMKYDTNENKFTPHSTSYHCGNCDSIINKHQMAHFNLS